MHPVPLSYAQKTVAFIGASSGWGAQRRETEFGPQALYDAGLLDELISSDIVTMWAENVKPMRPSSDLAFGYGRSTLPLVASHAQKLASVVSRILYQDCFPVVLGGDHSIATGTWAGVVNALNLVQNFGLIWIDAHMNAQLPQTSTTQAYHHMALATLLGYGEDQLVNIAVTKSKLNPRHVILIGTRYYDDHEAKLLNELGVTVYYMTDVENRGFDTVFKEAVQTLQLSTPGFGISLDLDAFDPFDAPGVSTRMTGGLKANDVIQSFKLLPTVSQFRALEITEFNPQHDIGGKTARLVIELLKHCLPK